MILLTIISLQSTDSFISLSGINVGAGINVWFHAIIAIVITFGILGTCTISINILTRYCAKHLRQ